MPLPTLPPEVSKTLAELHVSLGPIPAGFSTLADLADPANTALATWLERTGRQAKGMDRRTEAAYFAGYYCYLMGQVIGAFHLFGLPIPLRMEEHLALHHRLATLPSGNLKTELSLALPEACWDETAAPFDHNATRAVIEAIHAPVVELLYQHAGFARPATWRLVADGVGAGFLAIAKAHGMAERAVREAEAIIRHEGSPLNNPQVRFVEVCVPPAADHSGISEWFRLRGGCCRYYLTEGGGYCTTCVLRPAEEQVERIRAFLETKVRTAA